MAMILMLLLYLLSSMIYNSKAVNPGCECVVYSATYGKERGVFHSPDFPKPYPTNIDCILYTFIASPDEIIEIKFTDFDVNRADPDCLRGDYIKMFLHLERGEVNEYTPWAGLICGTVADIPPTLYSSGPGLVFEFHTDHKHTNSTGFKGTFRFIDKRLFQIDGQKLPGTMCDYQFTSSDYSPKSGRFYSPRYPSNYPKNVRCSYKFRARAKERVRVIFHEITLQKGDLSCINRADIIKVYDGRNSLAPTIKMLCNIESEMEIISSASDLYIEFIANSDAPGQGFKATYQFQAIAESSSIAAITTLTDDGLSGNSSPAVSATTSSCDVTFNSDATKNGTISSPAFTSASRTVCRYDFQGRGKERIQITFSEFSLYNSNDNQKECDEVDALVAFVHIDGHMEKIDTYCGTVLPKPIMSNGPRLMLQYKGAQSIRFSKGFKATYAFLENFGIQVGQQLTEFPCAFVFNSSERTNGSFYSPNYPGYYPRNTECHYFFHGQPFERVALHFDYFDVEGVLPCEAVSASDYVEFSNFMAKDRKYARHCGQMREFVIESDRKFFRVTFKSNDRLDGTGFHATYRFVNEKVHVVSTQSNTRVKSIASDGAIGRSSIVVVVLLVVFFSS